MKLFLITLNCLGSGLKCQVCNGTGGLCNSDSDNGQSKECPVGSNACYYGTVEGDNKATSRFCGHQSSAEKCQTFVEGYICNCDTDNCNRDRQCECSFSTNKQDTTSVTTKSTSITEATPKTTTTTNINNSSLPTIQFSTKKSAKTTTTSFSSTISISALATLTSALVFVQDKIN